MLDEHPVRLGVLLMAVFGLVTLGCSPGGSSQEYGSMKRSAQSVRDKLKSYSAETITAPADVCGGASTNVRTAAGADVEPGAGNEAAVDAASSEGAATKASVEVLATDTGLEVRSMGATIGQIVRALDSQTGERIVARGVGVDAPIYARVRGEESTRLLEKLARSVGMQVIVADGVTLVADAATAVRVLRRTAEKTGKVEPLEQTYLEAKRPNRTATLLAEFVLGCRGSILALPDKGVMLVEDTSDNLAEIEAWIGVFESEEGEIDKVYSRDRLDRYGVPEATLATCQSTAAASAPDDRTPMGQLVLQRAIAAGDDVIVGCGSGELVASNVDSVPQTILVQEFLGLEKIDERTWVSASYAERTRSAERAAELEDQWRLMRREPFPGELNMLLGHKIGGHYVTRGLGWGSDILLSVRTGYVEDFEALIAEYKALGEE